MASTDSRLNKLEFRPGFHRESTQYSEQGSWYDGNRVRFRNGKPENLRGYNLFTPTSFDGTARAIHTWADNNSEKLLGFGTEQKFYIYGNSGELTDVTPFRTLFDASDIQLTSGSGLVKVSITNHGVSVSDWLEFTSCTPTTGGFDLTSTNYGGPIYVVVSVDGLNNFYVSATSVAASTTTTQAGGGFYLASGLTNSIQGLGYGAGVYNAGASTTGERGWNAPANSSAITFALTQWSLDTWGEDLIANRRGEGIFYWDADASASPVRMVSVTNAPSFNNSIIVSPQDRHLIALGSVPFGGSDLDPMVVRWADQEDYTEWTPSATTTAGEFRLTDGTEIRGGIRSRNTINIWTDNALYLMQYVGPPFTFSQRQVGSNCGLLAPHAAVDYNGISYWMGENDFFAFDGQVKVLDCTFRTYLFENFNMAAADKVYAGINSEFREIVWLWPSMNSAATGVIDSYAIHSPEGNYWIYGSTFYSTYQDRNVFNNTVATGNNYVWNNEPEDIYSGYDPVTGQNTHLTSFIESADFDVQDGNDLMFIDRIIPDYDISDGSIQFTLKLKKYPAGPEITKGPYTITGSTQKVDLRARGRQANIRVDSDSATTSWSWGAPRMSMQPDGDR
jgi:hypothetical protein